VLCTTGVEGAKPCAFDIPQRTILSFGLFFGLFFGLSFGLFFGLSFGR
jgi:hypothetical protein